MQIYCFSYALKDTNVNDSNFDKLDNDIIPDIILVKKFYGHDKTAHRRARIWKLKHITDEIMNIDTENK
jgi:nonsense-mediated mRNA decay protein 3